MLDGIKKGQVNFIEFAHDNNCPTIASWNMDDCTCSAVEVSVHRDQKWYEQTLTKARSMNREARRAAERAMRKAARKTKAARATGAASKGTPTVAPNCSTRQKKGGAA